jgi:hypothetical protein
MRRSVLTVPACAATARLESLPMSRLSSEISRLYLPAPSQDAHAADGAWCLADAQDHTRALVLELARPADWDLLGQVWRGVQVDLAWPAPAIAVSGVDGFALWFSLVDPMPVTTASAVLQALRQRYLGQVPLDRLRLVPDDSQAARVDAVPSLQGRVDQWSAFVAPDLAPVFADTPWLDIPPSQEGQADLLSRLASIQRVEWLRALDALGLSRAPVESTPADPSTPVIAPSGPHTDPRRFLIEVMNNETVPLALRIEAAKALLSKA